MENQKSRNKKREEYFEIIVRKSSTKGITRRIDYSLIRRKNQRCRVLYKVEDITTFLVEYVKYWDKWEVDGYGNANLELGQVTTEGRYRYFHWICTYEENILDLQRTYQTIIDTIHVDFDELTALAFEHSSLGPVLHEMSPTTISSGLVPNPHPSTPFVPPSLTDWDMLFQPLFDEFLNPSPSVDHPAPKVVAPEVIAPVLADSTDLPLSTTVDKDAPSPSNSQTTPETEPPIIQNDVKLDPDKVM
ncbi:hypothetical protein Tco_0862829, partial [Tanacetum coccineum]